MSRNKKIILTAVLLAMLIILSRFLSIKTPILKISFAFVPTMLCAVWLGFKWTVLLNVLGDVIGATLFPTGPYFVGSGWLGTYSIDQDSFEFVEILLSSHC